MRKVKFTITEALAEYEEARQVALHHESASAMVSATTAKARLLGLLDGKYENESDDAPLEIKIV